MVKDSPQEQKLKKVNSTLFNMAYNNDTDKINSYINENNLRVNYTRDGEYLKISLYKDLDLISPILITIMGSPYEIKTSGAYYE